MWEGILGQWKDGVPNWPSCPAIAKTSPLTPSVSLWQQVVSVMNSYAGGGDVAKETDDDTLCPYHWAKPIQELSCEIVWPKALDEPPYNPGARWLSSDTESLVHRTEEDINFVDDGIGADSENIYLELDTPEYAGVISKTMLLEKLLAQAGIRLAAVINWLFADMEGNIPRVSLV